MGGNVVCRGALASGGDSGARVEAERRFAKVRISLAFTQILSAVLLISYC